MYSTKIPHPFRHVHRYLMLKTSELGSYLQSGVSYWLTTTFLKGVEMSLWVPVDSSIGKKSTEHTSPIWNGGYIFVADSGASSTERKNGVTHLQVNAHHIHSPTRHFLLGIPYLVKATSTDEYGQGQPWLFQHQQRVRAPTWTASSPTWIPYGLWLGLSLCSVSRLGRPLDFFSHSKVWFSC